MKHVHVMREFTFCTDVMGILSLWFELLTYSQKRTLSLVEHDIVIDAQTLS